MTAVRKHCVIGAALSTAALGLFSAAAIAQQPGISDDVVRIGVLTDMSGTFSDFAGKGAVEAVKMAVEDFGGKVNGKPIEVISADHQNKADIAASTAREWIDQKHVDMLADNSGSATALATIKIANDKKRIAIVTGAGTTRITNEDCTPYSLHYNHDTASLANVAGKYIVKQGGDTWFFLTADYSFGYSLQSDTSAVITANGGKVVGSVKHPFNASDFSSFMVQAQGSHAKIIGLANAGSDTINAIKSAREFGLLGAGKQQLAGLLVLITDVHALGLNTAQGLYITEGWYWDLNDETRKWSARFYKRMGKMPSAIQAADYSSTLHYLEAIKATGTDDSATVIKKMEETPVNDMYTKNGVIRKDGLLVHDMYLMQVKTPAESKKPWDYYNVREVVPGNEAYPSIAKGSCTFAKQ
ncbi:MULTISPECIES: ABC transporter substrate-binding protein [Burkholderiaceae]|uniref:Leucine-, isoleucine-, valine-, threonine-, and alanine-binding protein n=1 Tax=Caballeronia sordidicola TaxID=196367 RepID=A0A242N3I5_CABSO|nr:MULTISPECIES: ABC transporter substrate-binding protein [Burkholderiaceae]AMH43836.1 ABC transporter permease [Burkholderia sp. PAMC 26561]OTP78230.1 Leucine-, isoleucine-, valine-, threonine-, and alanine-binding protein [Caballeronia sordidicola]